MSTLLEEANPQQGQSASNATPSKHQPTSTPVSWLRVLPAILIFLDGHTRRAVG